MVGSEAARKTAFLAPAIQDGIDMIYTCPKDPSHESVDADYCSVCGARIEGSPLSLPTSGARDLSAGTSAASTAGLECPECGTPRASLTAKFCEVCRYNFEAGHSETVVLAAPAPELPPLLPETTASPLDVSPSMAANAANRPVRESGWEAIVEVDASLYTDVDPATPCPIGQPQLQFPLDLDENLIGRRNERRSVYPEIPLTDPGVSTRHAKLVRSPEGGWQLLDVGSTNGTMHNGSPVIPGLLTAILAGDQITLGCWTRIILRRTGREPGGTS